jgi:hypothetical protein
MHKLQHHRRAVYLDQPRNYGQNVKSASFDPVRKAIVYTRVSSKEQEKEGFSIQLLTEYATAND